MVQVTREVFFRTVGPLDVHPTPVGRYDDAAGGYLTEWRLVRESGRVVGTSQGEVYRVQERYAEGATPTAP